MKHWLDCPCCGEDVLGRAEPEWFEDEEEQCPDCGCIVSVRIDDAAVPAEAWTTVVEGDEGDRCP